MFSALADCGIGTSVAALVAVFRIWVWPVGNGSSTVTLKVSVIEPPGAMLHAAAPSRKSGGLPEANVPEAV